jgi:hypothetical protein
MINRKGSSPFFFLPDNSRWLSQRGGIGGQVGEIGGVVGGFVRLKFVVGEGVNRFFFCIFFN